MNMTAIQYFLALAETLSFTKAAQACRVSQPNISKQIQQFEAQIGEALFLRDKKRVALTAAGKELRKALLPQYHSLESTLRIARDRRFAAAPIRIACLPEVGQSTFFPLVLRFQSKTPSARIEMRYDLEPAILAKLRAGELDFGICTRGHTSEAIRAYRIFREEIRLVGNPKLFKQYMRGGKIIADDALPLVLFQKDDVLANTFLQQNKKSIKAKGIEVKLVVNSHRSMSQAVAAGIGFAILPLASVPKEFSDREVAFFPETKRVDELYLLEQETEHKTDELKALRTHLLQSLSR